MFVVGDAVAAVVAVSESSGSCGCGCGWRVCCLVPLAGCQRNWWL